MITPSKKKMICSAVAIISLVGNNFSLAQTSEELAKENRYHQIFKKYNEQPTPSDLWKSEISKGSLFNYQVQKKDTLWDISKALFADPNYWPKIWAINSKGLLNPHEISAGQQILFSDGTFGEPPSVAVKESLSAESVGTAELAGEPEAASEVADEKAPVYPNGLVTKDELPAPKVAGAGYADLPTSLPKWEALTGLADHKMLVKPIPAAHPVMDQILPYYVTETPPEIAGTISETEQGMKAASDRQFVYVKFKEPPSQSKYLVIEEKGKITDLTSPKTANTIQVLGQLEVIELVNPAKNIYRAKSTQMLSHFLVGSIVVPGEVAIVSPTFESPGQPLPAKIIGGANDLKRNLFGPQEIVYINKGSSGGVDVGQTFAVYKNQKARHRDSDVEINAPIIGHIKIVKVSDQFATAIVADVVDEIRVGDDLDSSQVDQKID